MMLLKKGVYDFFCGMALVFLSLGYSCLIVASKVVNQKCKYKINDTEHGFNVYFVWTDNV